MLICRRRQGRTHVDFQLHQIHGADGERTESQERISAGASAQAVAPTDPPATDREGARHDVLDQLVRTFEQWGESVQQRFQQQDHQLVRQLNSLRGEGQERAASLKAEIDDLNGGLGRLIGEVEPLLVEIAQLTDDRALLNAKLATLEAKLGRMVPRWQMVASFAAIVILGAGLCYLAYPNLLGALTHLARSIAV